MDNWLKSLLIRYADINKLQWIEHTLEDRIRIQNMAETKPTCRPYCICCSNNEVVLVAGTTLYNKDKEATGEHGHYNITITYSSEGY